MQAPMITIAWRLVLIGIFAHDSVRCSRIKVSREQAKDSVEGYDLQGSGADWMLLTSHDVSLVGEDDSRASCKIATYERCKTPAKCSHKLEVQAPTANIAKVYHDIVLAQSFLRDTDDGEFELVIQKDTFTFKAYTLFCSTGCAAYKRHRVATITASLEAFLQKASSDKVDLVDFYPNGDRCIDRSFLEQQVQVEAREPGNRDEVSVYAMQPLEFHQFMKLAQPRAPWRSRCLSESSDRDPSCSAVSGVSEDLAQLRSCIAIQLQNHANATLEEVDFDTLRVLKTLGWLSSTKNNKNDVMKQFKKDIFKTRTLHKRKLVEVYGKTLIQALLTTCFGEESKSQRSALAAICLPALYDLPAVTGHGVDEDHNAIFKTGEYVMPDFQTVDGQGQSHRPVEAAKWKNCPNIPSGCARWAVAKLAPTFSKQKYSFWKFHRYITELNPFNASARADWKQCLSITTSNCQLFPHCVELAMRRVCAEEVACCPNLVVQAACAEDPDGHKCNLCERTSSDLHLAIDYAKLGMKILRRKLLPASWRRHEDN